MTDSYLETRYGGLRSRLASRRLHDFVREEPVHTYDPDERKGKFVAAPADAFFYLKSHEIFSRVARTSNLI